MNTVVPTHKTQSGASVLTRQQDGYGRTIGIGDDLLDRDIAAVGLTCPLYYGEMQEMTT